MWHPPPVARKLILSLPVDGRRLAGDSRSRSSGRRGPWPIVSSCRHGGGNSADLRSIDGNLASSIWAKALAASAAIVVTLSSGLVGEAQAAKYQAGGDAPFDAMAYAGRWYEVASLKKGFAGEGQQDCHCTQGIYMPKKGAKEGKMGLEVNTFCVHGSPTGRISGIQGQVTCTNPEELKLKPQVETALERKEAIVEKCVLKFPAIPFIPPEPYDVIRTDYENYAIVQGAADTSFVQIYSRTPKPGKKFIEEQKKFLKQFGYPISSIRDTPQDCPEVPIPSLMGMMKKDSSMESMMTNTMPSTVQLANIQGVEFAGPRNILDEVTDFIGVLGQKING